MHTNDYQAAERLREEEHRNKILSQRLDEALKIAESLNSRNALNDAFEDYQKEKSELNSIIEDWRISFNSLLDVTYQLRDSLNIEHSDFLKTYSETLKSQSRKNNQPYSPIALSKHVKSLLEKKIIYDIGPDNYLSWKDIRRHWDEAANNGDPKAQFNMGWYLSDSPDKQEALKWFKLAHDQGEPNSFHQIEKIEKKNQADKSKEIALIVSQLLNDGSVEEALQLINDSIKNNCDWANLLEPYLKISFERIVHKNFFYKTTDEKGQKIKSFVQYCEINIKNNSDSELSIARPGSRLPARQRQEGTSKYIKLPPNQSTKVQIWALPPDTESDKDNYSSYEWIYPNLDYFKIPFRLPSNLKLDIYHRHEKANCL